MKKSTTKPDLMLCNQRVLASAFGVTVTTIVNWDKEGLPSTKRGKERLYNLPACIKWYLQREAEKLSSLPEEQARLAKVRRERQELLLSRERGELMLKEDAKYLFTEIGLHLKNTLESWPHRLAGRISGMRETRGITLLLKQEVRDLLLSLRDMEIK